MRHSDYRRNRVDLGRFIAMLLAVLLVVLIPLRGASASRAIEANKEIQKAIDYFTAKVRRTGVIALEDYEEMVALLNSSGKKLQTLLTVTRPIVITGEKPVTKNTFVNRSHSAVLCAAHVHSPACYIGHNHVASGCERHVHVTECYCPGRMTRQYMTGSYSLECFTCDGTGSILSEGTCSVCGGTGDELVSMRCNACRGSGREGYWDTCPRCDGNDPDCTRCNGSGHVDKTRDCTVCDATGVLERIITCTHCRGSGYARDYFSCPDCGGYGRRYFTETYYECAVCGKGSTTSYGEKCRNLVCGYQEEGYQCRIIDNDNTPICNKIIVDVQYENEQTIFRGDPVSSIDTDINVTYLDGSHSIVRALPDSPMPLNADTPPELTVQLRLSGYFGNAGNYQTRLFPLNIKLIDRTVVCPRCGKSYYPGASGCPYCVFEPIGIRAFCEKKVFEAGEVPDPQIFLMFEDHEELIEYDDCWDTFDSERYGTQTFIIGYDGFITELTVYLNAPPNSNSGDNGEGDTDTGENESGGNSGNPSGQSDNDNQENHGGSGDSGDSGTHNYPGDEGNTGGSGHTGGNGAGGENEGADIDVGSIDEGSGAVFSGGPSELFENSEIMDTLQAEGFLRLRPGDVLSVIVVSEGQSVFEKLGGIYSSGKRYSSGVII